MSGWLVRRARVVEFVAGMSEFLREWEGGVCESECFVWCLQVDSFAQVYFFEGHFIASHLKFMQQGQQEQYQSNTLINSQHYLQFHSIEQSKQVVCQQCLGFIIFNLQMSQDEQDRQNLANLRQLNHNKLEQIEHSSHQQCSHQHSEHQHQNQGHQAHNHASHGHQGHGHSSKKHHHGTPGKKNYVIIMYTIFTCLSCLYLQTQHLNPLIGDNRAQLMTYLCIFDVLMCLWSYLQTMRISSSVQKLRNKEHVPYAGLQVKNCEKCNFIKVPRVSHCSSCGKCIYKLDHHCIWTQTCIGYCNQRPFYLFTLYMSIGVLQFWYSTIRAASVLFGSCHFFGTFEPGVYILWAITCVSAGLVGMMIVSLWIGHTWMVATNFTTLDNIKKKMMCPLPFLQLRRPYYDASNVNAWDRGQIQNLKSLFGSNLLTCWLPFGRQIENQFLFEQMSPYITADHSVRQPLNITKEAIKEKLKGKVLKVQEEYVLADEL